MAMPARGYNLKTAEFETAVHGRMMLSTMVTWDLGGRERARALWRQQYKDADAVIFVVDSTDRRRLEESHMEFEDLLKEDELVDVPVLIYANKQDLHRAMSSVEIADFFGLKTLPRQWHIQESSTKTGAGVSVGLEWLMEVISASSQRTTSSQGTRLPLAACFEAKKDQHADDVSTADTEDAFSRAEVISAYS